MSVAVEAPVYVAEHSRGSHPLAWERQDTQDQRRNAGTYVFGSKGSNACPEGSTRIVNWAVCGMAAEDSGKSFYGNYSTTSVPTGCIVIDGYAGYFNPTSPGAAEANTQPLCIPGAPPRFCTAIVSHPADTPSGYSFGSMRAIRAGLKAHSRSHLHKRFSSRRSLEAMSALRACSARLLPTCAILVCGAKQFSLCVTMHAACVHV